MPSVANMPYPTIESLPLHRFSVDEYHALGSAGALSDDRVELLDGLIVMMNPIGAPHANSMRRTHSLLEALLSDEWDVRQQLPITLSGSEPQPDLSVVRGIFDDYAERHPGPGEIELVIEVADTTLQRDRKKAPIYAAAAIPQYWIINLRSRQVEVYTNPQPATRSAVAKYRSKQKHDETDKIKLTIAGRPLPTIAVRDLLPPSPNHK